jgi:transcriptional regulator with GAF, ATPase, and Fis domain
VADGGTVFLDEIGELPLLLQAKVLRVLETKSFRRVGSEKYLQTDVRIIAATNRDLKKSMEEERFRSDLFYRLNVVPISLPPLRERKEDIFPLIEYFVEFLNKKIGRNISDVANEALKLLIDYDWPGNIRELKNVIEHMVITSMGDVIRAESLPTEIRGTQMQLAFQSGDLMASDSETMPDFRKAKRAIVAGFEKSYLKKLLDKNEWNISQSAREIKMHRSSFQRLMRKYGLRKQI